MTVTSATGTSTAHAANPGSVVPSLRTPIQVLDSDDFMRLLGTQMSHQDPMNPMKDTDFIAQMASFSSLAQMNQLTRDFGFLRQDQARGIAGTYLGRNVTVADGAAVDGVRTGGVTGVDLSGPEPMLIIGGESHPLSAVIRLGEPPGGNDPLQSGG